MSVNASTSVSTDESLRIRHEIVGLVVSDIHDDVEGINLIRSKLKKEAIQIDFVLCPGDISTMPNSDYKEPPSKEELAKYEKRVGNILKSLDLIPRSRGKLFWIPGNHDPLSLFPESGFEPGLSMPGVNVHGSVSEVAQNLFVGGFGGSVEARENEKKVWKAYPYTDKDARSKIGILEKAIASEIKDKSQLLLMTHAGPDASSTTHVTGLDPNSLTHPGVRHHVIESGSGTVSRVVKSPIAQNACLLAMHGHTHHGMGVARVGSVPILNPGSTLHGGSFGLITLRRKEVKNKIALGPWRLAEIRILTLDRD